jgi:hypothetical protein
MKGRQTDKQADRQAHKDRQTDRQKGEQRGRGTTGRHFPLHHLNFNHKQESKFNPISDYPPCKRKLVNHPFVPEKSIRSNPIEKQRNGSNRSIGLAYLWQ